MRLRYLALLLLATSPLLSVADDLEKAQKQIRMITAMSRDDTARSIISRTFADAFKKDRMQMVAERRAMGLNYGSLFLAQEMALAGANMQEITGQLHTNKNILDVAKSVHLDWKRVASDAKKMNSRINDAIYKHFLHAGPDKERDQLEHYNPSVDLIRADADATTEEIAKAQGEYIFWRNLAAPKSDGQADIGTPVGQSYEQGRENIAISHGSNSSGPR